MIKKKLASLAMSLLIIGTLAVGNINAVNKNLYNINDVTQISRLSESEIKDRLPRRLKFLAHKLYVIESSDRPVNAIFLISLMRLETGNGTSYSFRVRKNVGGLTNSRGRMTFKSHEASLEYLHNLLNNKYIGAGKRTVHRIGYTYCGKGWGSKITGIMYSYK